ncbi:MULTISPECIES: hypothetical protein [unclassified Frankia]|uniref:hypothetical protein n=1 Tax=unclassified Frankia TaxID=2632575 RepID=UPI002AD28914|nr:MULTISPECIES: hypothetical protein [unclassified Frankia]
MVYVTVVLIAYVWLHNSHTGGIGRSRLPEEWLSRHGTASFVNALTGGGLPPLPVPT